MRIPFVPARQIPSRDQPFPIAPQPWRFRQSMEYSVSFNRAVIDYAARNREHLLFNIWRMGQRSIERGSQDHWTPSPSRINAVAETMGEPAGEAARARRGTRRGMRCGRPSFAIRAGSSSRPTSPTS
jgi:hypothetical protein